MSPTKSSPGRSQQSVRQTKGKASPKGRASPKAKGSPSPRAISALTDRVEADEAHAQALESSARRIDAVVTELRDRNLMRSRRVVARLDRSGPPLKHGLRQLGDGLGRGYLLRALRGERDAEVERILESGTLTWSAHSTRKDGLGAGLDERVVEIPLAVECAAPLEPGRILDAGAALNLPALRSHLSGEATIVHFTQSGKAERAELEEHRFSYMFGDLRKLPFLDGWFDRVLCISTLEHVGMDNERYGGPSEKSPETWRQAVQELVRVLSEQGTMMISVPFGRPRDLGWYRVFGLEDIGAVTESLSSLDTDVRYFACDGGWFDAQPDEIVELDDEESVIRGTVVIRARKAGKNG